MILPMEGDEASGWKPGKPTAFLNSSFRKLGRCSRRTGVGWRTNRETSGPTRGVRAAVSGPGRQVAGLDRRRPISDWSRTRRELFYCTNEPGRTT